VKTVLLGEAAEFLDHMRRPITSEARVPGPYPYYGANGQQDAVAGFLFSEPLVLLAEDGGHFDAPERGVAYRVDGPCWVNNHAHVLRPKPGVDCAYLGRVLENRDLRKHISGTTRAKLTKAGAARIEIPLPPIDEQRRIAAILDKADELRAKRRAALAHLDSLTQSIFLDMFGDPAANPMRWETRQLGAVAESNLGKMLDDRKRTGLDPRVYIKNTNVKWFRFDVEDLPTMDFDEGERVRFRLRAGDVLVCEGGEVGRAAVWSQEVEECYFQKALHRVRPNLEHLLPDYLVFVLHAMSRGGALAESVSTATIAHLTGVRLKALAIPVPPVARQHKFVSVLGQMAVARSNAIDALARQVELFASLQQRAFAGLL
jgi:type I restriction enzyme, S subunit